MCHRNNNNYQSHPGPRGRRGCCHRRRGHRGAGPTRGHGGPLALLGALFGAMKTRQQGNAIRDIPAGEKIQYGYRQQDQYQYEYGLEKGVAEDDITPEEWARIEAMEKEGDGKMEREKESMAGAGVGLGVDRRSTNPPSYRQVMKA